MDLTGVWTCNDHGKYYVRQKDQELFWFGERDVMPSEWSNVAHGKVEGDTAILSWADVPKGKVMQEGLLVLQIKTPKTLVAKTKIGGFGGSTWTKIS